MNDTNTQQFRTWLEENSNIAALVRREWYKPASDVAFPESEPEPIFPATYGKPKHIKDDEWLGYNLDQLRDGTWMCQIDSVGAQANRMECIFKKPPFATLVPQITVKVGSYTDSSGKEIDRLINLLDAGHRAADAIVRFAPRLAGDLELAFNDVLNGGDATRLAKIAPTSIVFGCWDSRATEAKLPRIVRSVVRAFDVERVTRSAQYEPPLRYVEAGIINEKFDKGSGTENPLSQEGFRHNPATATHGGVVVRGEIRRDVSLNLVALRSLGASGQCASELLEYILGLSLIAFAAPVNSSLREGCLLVGDPERPSSHFEIGHDGTQHPITLDLDEVLEFAEGAAKRFKVGESRECEFNSALAEAWLTLDKKKRKDVLRQGGITLEALGLSDGSSSGKATARQDKKSSKSRGK